MALLAVGLAIGLVATGLTATDGAAQLLAPPPAPAMPKDLRMHSVLYDANRLVVDNTLSAAEAARRLTAIGLVVDQDLVHVELVGPVGRDALSAIDQSAFGQRFRGRIDSAFDDRVDAWLPPDQLIAVADWLPEGFLLERANVPMLDAVAGEGPNDTVINSNGYRDGGANGAGVVIAVIDTQFSSLTSTRNNGDAPSAANTAIINLAPGIFESGGTHGTSCLEAAFDHCPGATWRLYKVDSVTDLGTVVADAIANGTDVISHSLSWYNLGWADDAGAACTAANQASAAGINFVTSAGNRALDHWEGNYNAGAGDADWHDWSPGDETLAMTVAPNASTTLTLSWNTAGGTFDYDLYLYDATGTNVLASSTNGGNAYESLTWMNSSASATQVLLAVRRVSGGATAFEVFGDNQISGFEYPIAAGSTTSPSNATGANVISVGAVAWNLYDTANGGTPIATYSSQGPSNSGMRLPTMCGPTNTKGFLNPGGFTGTSCATPNVAGAICAFWSDKTGWVGNATRFLIETQAAGIWHDWGTPGPDNVYGLGPCHLIDFVANTTWLSRAYGNVGNSSTGPFYTVSWAQAVAVAGGRLLIFPGGSYPETVTLNKPLTVETMINVATLGS